MEGLTTSRLVYRWDMRYGLCCTLVLLSLMELRIAARAQTPSAQEGEPASETAATETVATETVILGAPTAFDLSGERDELVWLEADTRLHREPAARSPVLTRLDVAVEVPVLERRGGWARVRSGAYKGWVLVDRELADAEPALKGTQSWAPPTSVAVAARLEHARSFLGDGERQLDLGPFRLYTDLPDGPRLDRLDGLAAQLATRFEERFGVTAAPGEDASVVLYANEATYRAYAGADRQIADLETAGHAVGPLAVLALAKRHPSEARQILVHELTHVLTHRALGPDLPAWLMEGLAEDLAYSRVSKSGVLLPGTLDGWSATRTQPMLGARGEMRLAVERSRGGPKPTLEFFLDRWDDPARPDLASFLELPWYDLMEPERRRIHYPMSAFFVRYLLRHHGEGFRAYLRGLSRGEPADVETLLMRLGVEDLERLEADFGRWLGGRGPWQEERSP